VLYGPLVHHGEWWRIFTVSLVHLGFAHIFFNLVLLWIVGQILEPGAGPVRFGVIYLVSVAAGSAAALIATPHAVSAGASGGVFGVAAAATIVMQRQGVRFWDTGFGPLLVINLVLDQFVLTNVSIWAHIGGAIGGLLVAEVMLRSRKAGHPELGLVGGVLIGVAAVALCLVAASP
jgi:rhomboid protease GluP